MQPEQIHRQAAFASDWDESASAFESSDAMLNRIWDLCRYSIKATTFAGVYVDGDRERTAYEADAYFSQLGRLYTDGDVQMARDTFDRLLQQPTWPSEWAPHMIFMAYAEWMQTGDTNWLAAHYAALKPKLQLDRALPDGLLRSTKAQITKGDVVDWPVGERDGFVFTPVNTVVNAYHFHALQLMSQLAAALGKHEDAKMFFEHSGRVKASFNEKLFDDKRGVYVDGLGTDHASLHANMFALAFGIVPEDRKPSVVKFIQSRGMACSVYGAQHLLDALYQAGAADYALALLTTNNLRSWAHMTYDVGTTITLEAWDDQFKTNEDWNHAWGAAPANLIPFQLMGVQPTEPGWKKFQIKPQPASLPQAALTLPTIRGTIGVAFTNHPGRQFDLLVTIPANSLADVFVPVTGVNPQLTLDAVRINGSKVGAFIRLPSLGSGSHQVSVRFEEPPTVANPKPALLGAGYSPEAKLDYKN